MPLWYLVMEAAKEWHMPPWKLVGGSPAIWFHRFKVLNQEKARISNKQRQRQ